MVVLTPCGCDKGDQYMNKGMILLTIQLVLFAVIGGGAVLIPTEHSTGQWIIGGIGILAGVVVAFMAIGEHGRINQGGPNAVPAPKANADLITSGLYRYIRHPIYTGVLLTAIGIVIWHGHVMTLVAYVLLVGLLTYKSLYEEDLLMAQYPEYGQYRLRTGRFLPKLGRF